MTNIDKKF